MNILITGGNSGIGAATAKELASNNKIFITYLKNKEKAQLIAKEIRALGGECVLIYADISTVEGCRRVFEEISYCTNTLDVLINCAGGLVSRVKTPQITWADMLAVFSLNVFSAMQLTSLMIPLLEKADSPCIVNITSGAILSGSSGAPLYASAKGALDVFTKSISRDIAPRIRANSIAPGIVETPFHDGITNEQTLKAWSIENPLRRNGEPKEIAHAVRFCIENTFLNGTRIEVDGGKKGI